MLINLDQPIVPISRRTNNWKKLCRWVRWVTIRLPFFPLDGSERKQNIRYGALSWELLGIHCTCKWTQTCIQVVGRRACISFDKNLAVGSYVRYFLYIFQCENSYKDVAMQLLMMHDAKRGEERRSINCYHGRVISSYFAQKVRYVEQVEQYEYWLFSYQQFSSPCNLDKMSHKAKTWLVMQLWIPSPQHLRAMKGLQSNCMSLMIDLSKLIHHIRFASSCICLVHTSYNRL